MSQTLIVQISDRTFDAIRTEAETVGASPVQVAAEALECHFRNGRSQTEEEKRAARERFERHFGELDLGSPTGADNERINDDLAHEYADNHEAN